MKIVPVSTDPAYRAFLRAVKEQVTSARLSASRSINRGLVGLYWEVGRLIVEQQEALGWGKAVVERLSHDLRTDFPDMTGFSPRNLWYIKRFYEAYVGTPAILQQLVAEIPWGQNIMILEKLADVEVRRWYLEATARFGWTRDVLRNQIKADAYHRSIETKTHNFPATLPDYLAEQADEALKSSYSLEFLGIARVMHERDLERRLLAQLKDFLLELGYGFCFIGSQYRLLLGKNEYFIDLLFYHRFLKCLVAIELKTGSFQPEYAGKMDFYLNVLNDKEKAPDDNPAIGIILCAERDHLEVEFSLKSKLNPIGVAEYQLCSILPAEYKGRLPEDREWQRLLDTTRSDEP